jgi:hypothetical protein
VLIEAVYSFDRTVQNVLLSTIEALESKEVLAVCDQMLHAVEEMTVPKNVLGKHFILLTANILLQRIDLSDIVAKYYSRCLSEYRYWLFLDAVATRMMVLHHLGVEVSCLGTPQSSLLCNTASILLLWREFCMLACVYRTLYLWGLYISLLCCVVLCCVVLCCVVLCCVVLCCVVLCCVVLCCAVLCCAVLCCAVLCCAVLCCAISCYVV